VDHPYHLVQNALGIVGESQHTFSPAQIKGVIGKLQLMRIHPVIRNGERKPCHSPLCLGNHRLAFVDPNGAPAWTNALRQALYFMPDPTADV
jgi:hypothetical protein